MDSRRDYLVLTISERAALRTFHEGPTCATISRSPSANLAARGASTTAVAVRDNGLRLGINVVRVTRSDSNIHSAQLIAGVDVNKRRPASSIHRGPSRIGAAGYRVAKDEPIGVACYRSETRTAAGAHRRAVDDR